MVNKINLSLSPPENYPSFEICQVNNCPLEPKPNNYKTVSEDKHLFNYHKCRCFKRNRMKIAKEFSLKNLGLTPRELAGMDQSIKFKELFSGSKGKKA